MEAKEKLSIVCFSGDFDRAVAALTLATGAAATIREVTLFFTFWGLNIVKKRGGHRWTGRGILARFFNFLMGGRNNLPLSRLNFGGLCPASDVGSAWRSLELEGFGTGSCLKQESGPKTSPA